MDSPASHPRDPLHGVTLQAIVIYLVEKFGWEEMGHRIPLRCFTHDPSVKSSLTFLRRTPWARTRVESWYLEDTCPAWSPPPPTEGTKIVRRRPDA